jgi:hypothetical protein
MSTPETIGKGYDDSPPRNGVIFFYTVLTLFVLVGVKLLLDSYFVKTMETEVHDKVLTRGLDAVAAQRAREKQELERTGIDSAIKTLAQRGRTASPLIVPQSGLGQPAGPGWSQLPRAQAAATPAPAPAEPAPAQPVNPIDSPAQPGEGAPGKQPGADKPAATVNPAARSN